MTDDCYACSGNADPDLPVRERVLTTPSWRVAHAFGSTLPGWLVVVPTRHVLSLDEMDESEAAELGTILQRLTRALREVVGCTKTYVMLLAEAEGYEHLHVHVVPRMPDQPAERRGPAVFGYLAEDEADWLPEHERDALAERIAAALG